jgi:hypothetical protein
VTKKEDAEVEDGRAAAGDDDENVFLGSEVWLAGGPGRCLSAKEEGERERERERERGEDEGS